MNIKKLLFTAFYTGYTPVAPGTAGTVVGVIIYIAEYLLIGSKSWIAHIVIVVLAIYPSIKLCDDGEKYFGKKDPSGVVLDEVVGYWVSVLFFPFNWKIVILAFIIFRILDITKPFPANKLQSLKGGFGILVDDLIAGIYTNIILVGIYFFSGYLGYNFY